MTDYARSKTAKVENTVITNHHSTFFFFFLKLKFTCEDTWLLRPHWADLWDWDKWGVEGGSSQKYLRDHIMPSKLGWWRPNTRYQTPHQYLDDKPAKKKKNCTCNQSLMMVGRRSKEMVKKKKTEKEKDDEEDKQSFRSFFFIVCRVNYIVITHNCKKKNTNTTELWT